MKCRRTIAQRLINALSGQDRVARHGKLELLFGSRVDRRAQRAASLLGRNRQGHGAYRGGVVSQLEVQAGLAWVRNA